MGACDEIAEILQWVGEDAGEKGERAFEALVVWVGRFVIRIMESIGLS